MKTRAEAEQLAGAMTDVGERMKVKMSHLLSPMDEPLGRAVGNALEVAEAVDALCGRGPADLMDVCLTAAAIMIPSAIAALQDRGPHGLSDILYAYASATVAGGSDGDGVMAASPGHLAAMGLAMLLGRFAFIIAGLAVAGSVAAKRTSIALTETARTTTPLFVALLVAVILLLGALSFFPAIALGPLAEHFEMLRGRSF